MAGGGQAAAGVEWTVEQTGTGRDPQPPIAITYTVSAEVTRIAGAEETVLIDYSGNRIFRLDPAGRACRSYLFGRPHAELPAASITVAAPATAPDRRHLGFGLQQALAQTAVAATPQRWGQQFPFATAEYRIARDFPGINELFAIAGQHRRVFQRYPLLRRLDPIGLLDLLAGFPVSGIISSPTGRILFIVQSPPRLTANLPTLPPPGTCDVTE